MELSEKIQKIRKDRGLTQEQFAQELFVSRTAVSKWETGRGTPSMDSLQMIAKLYGATLDDLLCAEDIVAIAENENKENLHRFAVNMDGMCNIAAVVGMLLPLYKVQQDGTFYSVPLYQFDGWLSLLYWLLPALMALCGAAELLCCCSERETCKQAARMSGFLLNVAAIVLLILSGQPYPAVLFLALLLLKGGIALAKHK